MLRISVSNGWLVVNKSVQQWLINGQECLEGSSMNFGYWAAEHSPFLQSMCTYRYLQTCYRLDQTSGFCHFDPFCHSHKQWQHLAGDGWSMMSSERSDEKRTEKIVLKSLSRSQGARQQGSNLWRTQDESAVCFSRGCVTRSANSDFSASTWTYSAVFIPSLHV